MPTRNWRTVSDLVIWFGAESRKLRNVLSVPFEPAIGPDHVIRQPGLQLHLRLKVSGALLSPSPSCEVRLSYLGAEKPVNDDCKLRVSQRNQHSINEVAVTKVFRRKSKTCRKGGPVDQPGMSIVDAPAMRLNRPLGMHQ